MPKPPAVTAPERAPLAQLESLTVEVLTLIEGLTPEELLASRLTRREVQKRLLLLAEAANALDGALRQSLPEIDWEAWTTCAGRIQAGGAAAEQALWFAASMLTPSTLGWLRLYREREPELRRGLDASPR